MESIGYSNSSLGFIIFDILTIASNQLQTADMLGEQIMELKGKIIGQRVRF
jgi:hypothetical protein